MFAVYHTPILECGSLLTLSFEKLPLFRSFHRPILLALRPRALRLLRVLIHTPLPANSSDTLRIYILLTMFQPCVTLLLSVKFSYS